MTALRAILPYRSYHFSGQDTLEFLQGQLTQDMVNITTTTCHYGAYCDAKGRMLANFLLHHDDRGYRLRLHETLADAVMRRLQMFILRAKVNITELSSTHFGLNQAAAELFCQKNQINLPEKWSCFQHENYTISALPNQLFELAIINNNINYLSSIRESETAIQKLRLSGGHFNILPATYESLLPQQTSLENWGAINYKKGCYVGQEVIARNKYRGKLRKGMGYAVIPIAEGMELPQNVTQDGKRVGQIVDYHHGPKEFACLAIMPLDSFEKKVKIGEQETIFFPIGE